VRGLGWRLRTSVAISGPKWFAQLDCPVGDRDAMFCQQDVDVAQAQAEPEIEPDRLMNDLRREPVLCVADLVLLGGYHLGNRTATLGTP
jgi:hypothetical protein